MLSQIFCAVIASIRRCAPMKCRGDATGIRDKRSYVQMQKEYRGIIAEEISRFCSGRIA